MAHSNDPTTSSRLVEASQATDDRAPKPGDDLSDLRRILIGPTAREVDQLRARLDDGARRAEEIAAVLPGVLVDQADDPAFVRALSPPIERAITGSVQRNPEPLAEALFPVMGPAIRKAVASSLASLVESFNRTLEHAVSWRSLRWRFEALRTHRSFAEVVLLKTLIYRVEQLFLIDRRTGLLLLHVQPGSAAVADVDMVSGMLTAIRDFVHDSFEVRHTEVLESMQVGELNVWIEAGPDAMLAAVIRGSAPRQLRVRLAEALETVHRQFGGDLGAFDGDVAPFEGARPALEACLTADYREPEAARRSWRVWAVLAMLAVGAAIWVALLLQERARQTAYLDALAAEPGLVLIGAERQGGRLVVSGLRDPLATDPASVLAVAGLGEDDVEGRWMPYQSLDAPLVLARARQALGPPAGTELRFAEGVLSASGDAPLAWVADAGRMAPVIGGVDRFDPTGVFATHEAALTDAIEGTTLLFVTGSTRLVDGQTVARDTLVDALERLEALAAAASGRYAIVVRGHSDLQGAETSNLALSRQRAEAIVAQLPLDRLDHLDVVAEGVGSRDPIVSGTNASELQPNRRVSVHVTRGAGI